VLAEVLAGGGQPASVAAYAMVVVMTCPDGTDFWQVLVDHMVYNMTTSQAVAVAQDFAAACDTVGIGACVTVTVLDPDNGAILYEQHAHTSVAVPDSAAED